MTIYRLPLDELAGPDKRESGTDNHRKKVLNDRVLE